MKAIRNLNQRRSNVDTWVKQRRWALYLLLSGLVFSLPASTIAASNQAIVFGPKTYTRTSGRPNSFQENFTASNISSSFTLIVQNGDGENRSNGVRIMLNGVEVLGPNDFNQPMDSIRKSVTLLENNTMTVELRSRPGSFITVSLVRDDGYVYINNNQLGTNTVMAFSVDANGALTPIGGSPFPTGGGGLQSGLLAANRMTIGTVTKFLFVANEQTNNISVFSIDLATGALTVVPGSPFPYGGTLSSDISLGVTPDNRFLFASSPGSNNITVFSIAPNGTLIPISGSPFAAGGVPLGIKVSPDGRFLAVALILEDAVGIFAIAPNGALTAVPGSPFPAAALGAVAGVDINCASSLLFGQEGSLLGTNIDVFSIGSNGALTPIPGSPFNNEGIGISSSAVVLSPSDEHLFVSNPGGRTGITVFNVAADGTLSLVPGSPFADDAFGPPATMATNEAGTLLYVYEDIGAVSVFRIAADGKLTPVPGSPFFTGLAAVGGIAAFPSKNCSQN